MRRPNLELRNNIIQLRNEGLSFAQIASKLNTSTSVVQYHCPSSLRQLATIKKGRKRILTDRDERLVVRKIVSGQLKNAVEGQMMLSKGLSIKLSAETVRRSLRRNGLKSIKKPKKPLLNAKHMEERYKFALAHKDWTKEDWRRVVWSDETKINRFGSDGITWGWKKEGESLQPHHVRPTLKHGGGSIMVWGCITSEGPGYLTRIDVNMTSNVYCEILNDELRKSIDYYDLDESKLHFQHDNDPKHTSKKTAEELRKFQFQVLPWPSQSPDLNPIEHIWALLKRRLVSDYEDPPSGILELWDRVEEVWNSITKEECLQVIDSMPDRIRAVIDAKGGYTKY